MALLSGQQIADRQSMVNRYFSESAIENCANNDQINLLEDNRIWQFPRWGGDSTNIFRLSQLGFKLFKKYSQVDALHIPLIINKTFIPVKMTAAISKNLVEPYYMDTYALSIFGYADKSWFVLYDSAIDKIYKAISS
jgi:hypothetical protein